MTESTNDVKASEEKSETSVVNDNAKEDTTVSTENVKQKSGFIARLTATVIDQVLIVALALVIMLAAAGILHLVGYQFAADHKVKSFFIIYVVTNILYVPITEITHLNMTPGKSLLKIE